MDRLVTTRISCEMAPLTEVTEEQKQKYLQSIPYGFEYANGIWPGSVVSAAKFDSLKDEEFGEDDVIIVTYPKSGTTWISEVLSAIAHEGDVEKIKGIRMDLRVPWIDWALPLEEAPVTNPKKKISFTHLPFDALPKSIKEGKCKMIYVARNPKDQAVSFYHFHRMAAFLGTQKDFKWEEFFPLFLSGYICCGSWFDHVLPYWKFTRDNKNTMFVTFEDMKMDPLGKQKELEKFIGVELTPEQSEKVMEHCSFDAMKKNKMTNREEVYQLFDQSTVPFMRKGIVGDWKNYFTVAQNEAFDKLYKEKVAGTGLDFPFE